MTIREPDEQKFLNDIGRNIRQIRLRKDLSQERLAFKSNLDRTYIGGVERGERNLSILNLKKIADALEEPLEAIIKENND